jgi:hypothetical protein
MRPISRSSVVFTLTAAFAACGHTLALAQGVPDLSRFDQATRQSIELACITQESKGPVAYGECLNRQIDTLRGSPGIPSLSGLDQATRQSIELACITQESKGPVAYGNCLRGQIDALGSSPGIPSLSSLDDATRHSIEFACITQESKGPVAYGGCLRAQLHSIGLQPSEAGDATHVASPGATHVPSTAATRVRSTGTRHLPSTNATHVPPTDAVPTHTARVPSTNPSQATRREYIGSPRFWRDAAPFLVLFMLGFVYLAPGLWVLLSKRSHGGAKFGWLLVALFFTWVGLAVFLIATQSPRNRSLERVP